MTYITLKGVGSGPYTTPAGDFSTLVKNADNTYTRTLKDGTKQNFGTTGLQTSIVDLNSNRVTITYDGSNNLSTITDPNNLVTTFSYSGSCGATGKVCTITDPANRITSLTYNASGRLESVKDPDGAIASFTYDSSSGRMTTFKDPLSNVSTFTYNFAGRVTALTRPDSTTETFKALQLQSLCDSGQCTQASPGTPLLAAEAVSDYTDPRSNAWDYRLDWNGFGMNTQLTDPLGQTAPAGHMIVSHRDANACVTQFTDRLDRNTGFTLDSKCNPTTRKLPDGNTQQFEFNANSQVTKKTDELGRVTTLTYDTSGNLTQVTRADPDGAGPLTPPITTMTYDSQGRMTALTDARNKITTFSYDSRDRVTQITYADDDGDANNNPKVTFTYDSASNLETRKDERGNTTTFSYDNMGRTKTVTTPDRDGAGPLPAPVTTLSYDAAGNLTVVTQPDPDGTGPLTSPVTSFTYNSMNRRVTAVDPTNNTTTLTYDNAGNVATVTDPLSRTTTFSYNELGYRTVVTQPDPDAGGPLTSPVTTFTYDAEGQVSSIRDPLNRITTFTYTNRGWHHTTTDALNNSTTFSYDAVGNRTSAQEPAGGGTENFQYDALNRVTRAEDGVGNARTFTYDAVDNRTSIKNGLGHTTTFSYDARNRLQTITQPDPDGGGPLTSPVTTFAYDNSGNRTAVTDPLSRTVTYSYDAANRITSVTQPDPDGGGPLGTPITTFTYDNLDRLTSLKDPVNNLTTWTYDAASRVLTEVDPLNKTATTTYDAAGQVTKILDRKNQRREFVYDNLARVTQEKWCTTASGTCTTSRIFTHTYDAASQLTEVNESDSRYTFTYDNVGRVTGISSLASNMPQVTLTNVYNAAGNRTNVSDNLATAGTITFTYDAAHRMTQAAMTVGGTLGPEANFGYDAASRLTSMTRRVPPAGQNDPRIESTFGYDNADRLTALTHTYLQNGSPATTLATYTYSYNAASELTGETNADGTYTYTYDNTGQLTGVDASGGTCGATGCDESFSYDTNGNRTMTGYTTGTGNRLTSDGTFNYTYDDNGNMLTKTRISDSQKTEFTWDYRNRLTQVLLKNSGGTILQQTDYTYDAFDRRIIKSFDDDGPGPNSATTTKTLYDGAGFAANSYADFNGSNTLTMRYLYGAAVDMILARRDASGIVAWYLADHLGSVRDIANTSGTVIDHIRYSAYGKVTSETQPSNGDRFTFTGRERDSETNLAYYRARQYDAAVGRFVSPDPIGFSAHDPNLYRYVLNGPTIERDPSGLAPPIEEQIMGSGGGTFIAGMSMGVGNDYDAFVDSLLGGLAAGGIAVVSVIDLFIPYDEVFDVALGIFRMRGAFRRIANGVETLVDLKFIDKVDDAAGTAHGQVCFVAGTPIKTDEGTKAIELVAAGDWVLAADAERLAVGTVLAYHSAVSDDDKEDAIAFEWRYVWFGAAVLAAICVLVHRRRQKRRQLAAVDNALEEELAGHAVPDCQLNQEENADARWLATPHGSRTVGPEYQVAKRGTITLDCQQHRKATTRRLQYVTPSTDISVSGKTPAMKSSGSSRIQSKTRNQGSEATRCPTAANTALTTTRCQQRPHRSSGRLRRFAVAAATALALVTCMNMLHIRAQTDRRDGKPDQARLAQPVHNAPIEEVAPHRVLYYTYVESTGPAEASWLLPESAQVALADGTHRRVEELQPGERTTLAQDVIGTVQSVSGPFLVRGPPQSASDSAAATPFRRVLGTVKHTTDTLVDLRYEGETVSTTPDHPFWEARHRDWVPAGKLRVGDLLVTASGSKIAIESIDIRHGRFTVYNLEVEGAHNYFAGQPSVLVHNNPCGNAPHFDPPASTPVGRRGKPMHVPAGTNAPTTINGRPYADHAIDQMQGRGIPPSVVENTIDHGAESASRQGRTAYYDAVNDVHVVCEPDGTVVTVCHGVPGT